MCFLIALTILKFMKDSTLIKISLIFALISIGTIAYLSDKLKINTIDIASINQGMIDMNVRVNGVVMNVMKSKTLQVLDISDPTGSIQVVVFDTNAKINKGAYLDVEGKISKYKNNLQINSDSINEVVK